ncbi:DUF1573 domain-containing protein [Rariglobus hedericola]|uniref:DUF1573 domain-containing protein n=1 Tax=Rariglobus hedericola TaxID=2597822 RepID=UPI001396ADAF|nr:DUF1573 domain-containing protein [Rariglobus hedericola]
MNRITFSKTQTMSRYFSDLSVVSHRWRLWTVIALMLGIGPSLFALTWEKSSLDYTVESGSGQLIMEFPFKNESSEPVTITELKSSCGCSEPTVKTKAIPAGGGDVVKVVYTPGDRVGPQSAQITVTTNEAGVAPVSLRLRVDIKPVVSLVPRLVRWVKADGIVPRTIEIKQLGEKPVRILEVKPVSDALSAELKPGSEAGLWTLTLTPKSLDLPSTTKVEVFTEVNGHKTTYSVFGVVR